MVAFNVIAANFLVLILIFLGGSSCLSKLDVDKSKWFISITFTFGKQHLVIVLILSVNKSQANCDDVSYNSLTLPFLFKHNKLNTGI